jgi:hypothetical protein
MGVNLTIVEGPAGPPPDVSRIVATLGWAPELAVASPDTEVAQVDSLLGLSDAVGIALGPEAVARRVRISRVRGLLVPHLASVAGIISAVTQVGLGPSVSVASTDTHPSDDSSVIIRIVDPGAPGVATYQVSTAYNVIGQGNIQRLYGPALVMPERAKATALGTVDLTTLNYADPAIKIGTADVSDPTLYGAGGTLAGLTLIMDVDNAASPVTATIGTGASAPANLDALIAQLNAAFLAAGATFDYTNFPYLRISGTDLGTTGELDITGGTGLTALGLTVSTTNGTAGALDGLTLLMQADTGGAQTVTFGTGTSAQADADAVIAHISAATNITAALYSSRNLLQIVSDTQGASSTLAITGGTGRATLGLSIATAEGAEPAHEFTHLGITATFAAGTYRSASTYAFTTRAPRPSVSEVEDRLRELDAAGFAFGVVHIAPTFNAADALALAGALDTLGAEWEARAGNPRATRFVIGVDVDELDSVVKTTLASGSFRSRRVDIAARGAYVTHGLVQGGGRALRSQSWSTADADALLSFFRDRGERRLDELRFGFPEVFAITTDENTATVKLVNPTGPRFSVMVVGSPGFQFSGGYSFADASSAFTDSSVRNTTHVAFLAGYAQLALNENRTDLDTNADGTLTEASADIVASAVADAVADAIVPGGATAVQASVDTSIDFYTTRKLKGSIKFQDRKPAREVEFSIGPGLITDQ